MLSLVFELAGLSLCHFGCAVRNFQSQNMSHCCSLAEKLLATSMGSKSRGYLDLKWTSLWKSGPIGQAHCSIRWIIKEFWSG